MEIRQETPTYKYQNNSKSPMYAYFEGAPKLGDPFQDKEDPSAQVLGGTFFKKNDMEGLLNNINQPLFNTEKTQHLQVNNKGKQNTLQSSPNYQNCFFPGKSPSADLVNNVNNLNKNLMGNNMNVNPTNQQPEANEGLNKKNNM